MLPSPARMDESFAVRLKRCLAQRQLQLKQVAEHLGVSPSAVHKWTRGGEIEYPRLVALARLLGVNWVWLRHGEEGLAELERTGASDPQIRALRQKHLGDIMESEARMTLAQEAAGIVTWEWNVLTDALSTSANAARLFGRPLSAMDDLRACLHPADAPLASQLQQRALTGSGLQEWEFRVLREAEVHWIASRVSLLRDAEQRPVKLIGVSLDVSERRLTEAALRRSEALLAKAQQLAHLGGWYWNLQTDDCLWTDEAYRIFGWAPQSFKVSMERYLEVIVEEDRERVAAAIQQAIHGRSGYRIEYTIRWPDGSRRRIREDGEVALDERGQAATMVGASQDITADPG